MGDRSGRHDGIASAARRGEAPRRADLLSLAADGGAADFLRAGLALAGLRPDAGGDPDAAGGGARPIRVGILGTATVGSLEPILRAALCAADLSPELEAGPYRGLERELGVPGSAFAEADRDLLCCLLDAAFFVPADWDAADADGLAAAVRARGEALRESAVSAASRTTATVVLHTVPLPGELRDSLIGWRARTALSRHWHLMNASLLELAETHRGIETVDLAGLLAESAAPAVDDRLRRFADIPYTDEALLVLAREVRRLAQAKLGTSRKVLALDLDGTLWGGTLGEDGAEGVEVGGLYPGNCYKELQRAVRRLRDQGVVLVLASKNDAEAAEAALAAHPEVLLRPEAFSVLAVNWSAKAANLRAAAEELGLPPGSFVFMDDSPFERGHVAEEHPEIAVVAADGDPAYLVRRLLAGGWFDVLELTETDRRRPDLYRARAVRSRFAGEFSSSLEYLEALETVASIGPVSRFDTGRVAQLAARTNQFNLTGVRFDAARTAAMAATDDHLVVGCRVSDRFGDEELVGAAWVDRGPGGWEVRNLAMSCRVLGRGVELALVAWLARAARAAGAAFLDGLYVRSPRNGVAADLWTRAGFGLVDEHDGGRRFRLVLDETAGDAVPHWIRVRGGDHA
ncbi:HAD-IIIC family phosphatase [Actinomadura sp. GTD37]|uniref:HAD-IIIC family phosphatase n=1 Tax=Actinomadura sp. GTD37 TaxID=1778030 RepID=UPI0035C03D89